MLEDCGAHGYTAVDYVLVQNSRKLMRIFFIEPSMEDEPALRTVKRIKKQRIIPRRRKKPTI
jgi:hypothetical protein